MTDVAAIAAVEPAGFWIRAAGRVIDWVPVGIAMVCTAFVLGAGAHFAPGIEQAFDDSFLMKVVVFIAALLYHAFSEAVAGSTLGKRMLGLEVVGENLGAATMLQTLKRNLAALVDGLFLGLVGYRSMKDSPERQRIGDVWGKTIVIKRRSLPAAVRRPRGIWIITFFAAIGIASEVIALGVLGSYWLRR